MRRRQRGLSFQYQWFLKCKFFWQYDLKHFFCILLKMFPAYISKYRAITWFREIESRSTLKQTILFYSTQSQVYMQGLVVNFGKDNDLLFILFNKFIKILSIKQKLYSLHILRQEDASDEFIILMLCENWFYIIVMAKAQKKKGIGKSQKGQRKKLPRGYKECANCSTLLNIHKYVCDKCGHRHDMKRKKVDILKNLNNLTPKLLRSLIQLNDFNDISELTLPPPSYPPSNFLKIEIAAPQQFKRRRSSKSVSNAASQTNSLNLINGKGYSYTNIGGSLTSICTIGSDVIFAQSVEKHSDFSDSQRTTIKAYGLQKYHKIGQIYEGKTILSYISDKRIIYRIVVQDHIIQLRALGNKVAALTGRGTILIFDLDTKHQQRETNFQLKDCIEIKAFGQQDTVTAMEWMKGHSNSLEGYLVIGTLMGHLICYSVSQGKAELLRFISQAHMESVSAISQCPLSNLEQTLFASGSYDGSLAIWSSNSRECIYRMQVSNRKIASLLWDPGAKFIFVIRDENQESGVLACFFAILKNQQSVALSNQIDFRLSKCSPNSKILYNGSSQICLIDSYSGQIRVLCTEDLRKNSLKRKKVKRQEQERIYQIDINGKNNLGGMNQAQKSFLLPQIADATVVSKASESEIWIITYDGMLYIQKIS